MGNMEAIRVWGGGRPPIERRLDARFCVSTIRPPFSRSPSAQPRLSLSTLREDVTSSWRGSSNAYMLRGRRKTRGVSAARRRSLPLVAAPRASVRPLFQDVRHLCSVVGTPAVWTAVAVLSFLQRGWGVHNRFQASQRVLPRPHLAHICCCPCRAERIAITIAASSAQGSREQRQPCRVTRPRMR